MATVTTFERAICVFEQNTGVPLRRHLSYSRRQGAFYGGMSDSVLTVRSILTIGNYDYVVDFVFHQVRLISDVCLSSEAALPIHLWPPSFPSVYSSLSRALKRVSPLCIPPSVVPSLPSHLHSTSVFLGLTPALANGSKDLSHKAR